MGVFITEDILSENNLTATTANVTTIQVTTVSATTYYGDGSNLTGVQVAPGGPTDSIQFNNNGVLSGSSAFDFTNGELIFTGTTRFTGSFFQTNSPSVKLLYQWSGNITPNTVTPGIIWTNMPSAASTWLGTTLTNDATYLTDLTEYTECRLFTSTQASATTNANLGVQFATALGGPYSTLVSTNVGGVITVAAGIARDSGWTGITSGARGLVYIRLIGVDGNGADDPRFSPPTLLIR